VGENGFAQFLEDIIFQRSIWCRQRSKIVNVHVATF